MPISTKSIVHTTGNNQPGGESGGFCRLSKSFMELRVINAESPPTKSGMAIFTISVFHLIFNYTTSQTIYTKNKKFIHLNNVENCYSYSIIVLGQKNPESLRLRDFELFLLIFN